GRLDRGRRDDMGACADRTSRARRPVAGLRSSWVLASDGHVARSHVPRKRVVARRRQMESLVIDPQFWKGRRVYLTGHTGFKGGWAALMLWRLGAKGTGFALPPAESALVETAELASLIAKHETGDIRHLSSLAASVRNAEPEIVIHLAAQPLVRLSYDEPVATYETNVMGTVHLLEAVRRVGSVRATVIVTSDKCYENIGSVQRYRET